MAKLVKPAIPGKTRKTGRLGRLEYRLGRSTLKDVRVRIVSWLVIVKLTVGS